DGNLVGIHSRIGTSIADNRHVPIDRFTASWDRLAKGEDWNPANQPLAWARNQPWFGVNGSDDPAGYRVQMVDDSGPASLAGIQPGDVIVAFAGKPIGREGTSHRLTTLIGTCRIGDIVEVELLRDGSDTLRIPVKLGRRPAS
ncbi:MAG TPA: PDZ domain-containing protein, partial [Tepidisphaeraceae bacterium]|nr:PDZ domain-containing protein [Tepidisphaeraceae bacterium]